MIDVGAKIQNISGPDASKRLYKSDARIELCDNNKTLKKFKLIFFYKNKAETEKIGFKGKSVELAITKHLAYIISCDTNKSSRSPDHHTGSF